MPAPEHISAAAKAIWQHLDDGGTPDPWELEPIIARHCTPMPCRHPRSDVSSTDKGAGHCAACEREARLVKALEPFAGLWHA